MNVINKGLHKRPSYVFHYTSSIFVWTQGNFRFICCWRLDWSGSSCRNPRLFRFLQLKTSETMKDQFNLCYHLTNQNLEKRFLCVNSWISQNKILSVLLQNNIHAADLNSKLRDLNKNLRMQWTVSDNT